MLGDSAWLVWRQVQFGYRCAPFAHVFGSVLPSVVGLMVSYGMPVDECSQMVETDGRSFWDLGGS